jgi:hypothetical protein
LRIWLSQLLAVVGLMLVLGLGAWSGFPRGWAAMTAVASAG